MIPPNAEMIYIQLGQSRWGMEIFPKKLGSISSPTNPLHPGRLRAGTYSHHQWFRKDNDLNQTSMRTCSMLIFRGVNNQGACFHCSGVKLNDVTDDQRFPNFGRMLSRNCPTQNFKIMKSRACWWPHWGPFFWSFHMTKPQLQTSVVKPQEFCWEFRIFKSHEWHWIHPKTIPGDNYCLKKNWKIHHSIMSAGFSKNSQKGSISLSLVSLSNL